MSMIPQNHKTPDLSSIACKALKLLNRAKHVKCMMRNCIRGSDTEDNTGK
jgi:hypothetical protein